MGLNIDTFFFIMFAVIAALIILYLFALLDKALVAFGYWLQAMPERREKQRRFCRYQITEHATGEVVIIGEKFRDCKDLKDNGTFMHFFREIHEYERMVEINGILCKITFWQNAPLQEPCRFVTEYGEKLGFK